MLRIAQARCWRRLKHRAWIHAWQHRLVLHEGTKSIRPWWCHETTTLVRQLLLQAAWGVQKPVMAALADGSARHGHERKRAPSSGGRVHTNYSETERRSPLLRQAKGKNLLRSSGAARELSTPPSLLVRASHRHAAVFQQQTTQFRCRLLAGGTDEPLKHKAPPRVASLQLVRCPGRVIRANWKP